jgi:hypothetical protein
MGDASNKHKMRFAHLFFSPYNRSNKFGDTFQKK